MPKQPSRDSRSTSQGGGGFEVRVYTVVSVDSRRAVHPAYTVAIDYPAGSFDILPLNTGNEYNDCRNHMPKPSLSTPKTRPRRSATTENERN